MGDFFSLTGRLNRGRYIWFGIILGLMNLAAVLIIVNTGWDFVGVGIYLLALVAGIGRVIRRLHDLNLSGLFYILIFIPIVSTITYLCLLFIPGTRGPNKYGNDPLT